MSKCDELLPFWAFGLFIVVFQVPASQPARHRQAAEGGVCDDDIQVGVVIVSHLYIAGLCDKNNMRWSTGWSVVGARG